MTQEPGTAVAKREAAPPKAWEESGIPLEVVGMARALYASGLFANVTSVAAAITKIQLGNQLHLTAIESLQYLHIFQSKGGKTNIQLGYPVVGSLIQRSGKYRYEVIKNDHAIADIDFIRIRQDGSEVKIGKSVFTMEQAVRAGLVRDGVWKEYPAIMLFARALTQGQRRFCPEVTGGAGVAADEPYIEGEVVAQRAEAVIASPEGVVARDITPPVNRIDEQARASAEARPKALEGEVIGEGEHREVLTGIDEETPYDEAKTFAVLGSDPEPVTITGDDEPPPDPWARFWAKMRETFPDQDTDAIRSWVHKLVRVPDTKGALADHIRQKAIKENKTVPQLVAELLVRVEDVVARQAAQERAKGEHLGTNPLVEQAKKAAARAKPSKAVEVIDGREVEVDEAQLRQEYEVDEDARFE